VDFEGAADADVRIGTAASEVFVTGDSSDFVFGLGGADVYRLGRGDDHLILSDLLFARIDGGLGSDRVVLSGVITGLNLTDIADSRITGIERIDLGGVAGITVSALEVVNLSDTSNTLRINGVGVETVYAQGLWTAAGQISPDFTYNVYTNGAAILHVQDGVQFIEGVPIITSGGGGATAAVSIFEGQSAVTTVTASDPNGTPTFSIVGGADAGFFEIDFNTGALTFTGAPDFENPLDAGADNVYDVFVQATDGGGFDTQLISVTVGNVNEAPEGSGSVVEVPEAGTYAFGLADFGFSDPVDEPDNAFAAVKITDVAAITGGTLTLNDVAVTEGQFVSAADILDGDLEFTQDTGAAAGDTSFSFQVQDDGGEENGGVDLDPTPGSVSLNLLDFLGDDSDGDAHASGVVDARISGRGGDDTLEGYTGLDTIYGGDGADWITGGDGRDLISVGEEDGDADLVIYNDVLSDGGDAGQPFGFDLILVGFLAGAGNDVIHFAGGGAGQTIDDSTADDTIAWAVDPGTLVDLGVGGTEAVLLTTGIDIGDLIAADFPDLVAALSTVFGDAAGGQDALLVAHGGASGTGVYYFLEDGITGHVASELTMLAFVQGALLVQENFTLDNPPM
jgi:hypothetical protein